MAAIRVGLCNPNISIRNGKRLLVNSQSDMAVVFEASSAIEVLDAIDDLTLDVLVIDHRLSGKNGVWLVEQLNARAFRLGDFPVTTIITAPFFSVDLDIAVMRSGASDFVVEEAGPEEFLASVRNGVRQNRDFDLATLVQLLTGANVLQQSSAEFNLRLESLDDKLLKVLSLFEQGLSDQEIADITNSSLMRVRQTFKKMLTHFNFATKAQLALALYEAGRLEG